MKICYTITEHAQTGQRIAWTFFACITAKSRSVAERARAHIVSDDDTVFASNIDGGGDGLTKWTSEWVSEWGEVDSIEETFNKRPKRDTVQQKSILWTMPPVLSSPRRSDAWAEINWINFGNFNCILFRLPFFSFYFIFPLSSHLALSLLGRLVTPSRLYEPNTLNEAIFEYLIMVIYIN